MRARLFVLGILFPGQHAQLTKCFPGHTRVSVHDVLVHDSRAKAKQGRARIARWLTERKGF
jgi:hypothetical protein